MSEPPRRRVSIPTGPEESSERRSFFRIAAILGVLVGIPVGIFGLPALLNVFFDEPTVPVGGSWSDDGLILWVESLEVDEGPPRVVTVTLAVRTAEPWSLEPQEIELELSEGDPVTVDPVTAPDVFDVGTQGRIVFRFTLPEADRDAEPRAVRLAEPKARFELTESEH